MDEFTYLALYFTADVLTCENFEGFPRRMSYTADQINYLRYSQKPFLIIPLGLDGIQLVSSKQLRKPIQAIKDKVNNILSGLETKDDLKFILYSAHDGDIANLLTFLNPVNHNFIDIPFASSIVIELHYDDQCLADK